MKLTRQGKGKGKGKGKAISNGVPPIQESLGNLVVIEKVKHKEGKRSSGGFLVDNKINPNTQNVKMWTGLNDVITGN